MDKANTKRVFILFLTAIGVSLLIAGCGKSSGDDTTTAAAAAGTLSVDAGADQLNVGYGASVTLTATVTGGGATYLWSQTDGELVELSGVDLAQASITFNTLPLAAHKPNIPDEFAMLGISAEEAGRYTFEVEVTSRGQTATDTVVIRCTSATTSLKNVPVGAPAYMNAGVQGSYVWTVVSAPAGSAITTASIVGAATQTPFFVPDISGQYVINEAVRGSITIIAGEWVGVGTITGAAAVPPTCGACHRIPQWAPDDRCLVPDLLDPLCFIPDMVTPWEGTGHATVFADKIDTLPYYKAGCIECHTVGFDQVLTADNNGFDDVADSLGWEFPGAGMAGTWQGIIDIYPTLAEKSNIQCENCHGPGSNHYGDPTMIETSLRVEVCAACHDDPGYHMKPNEWYNAGHAKLNNYPAGRTSCSRCHEGNGFVDFSRWLNAGNTPDTYSGISAPAADRVPQTCATCHDPHDNTNSHQLRLEGDAYLPNGTTFDAGLAAVCFTCHNSRRNITDYNGDTISDSTDIDAAKADSLEPHNSTQAEMFAVQNFMDVNLLGITYTYSPSYHVTDSFLAPGSAKKAYCVVCHMADDPTGNSLVGGHTFNLHDEASGEENIEACQQCHGPNLTTYDRKARADYDGDGLVEGIQTEVEGLSEEVEARLLQEVCTLKGWTCAAPVLTGGSLSSVPGCSGRGIFFYDDDDPANGSYDSATESDEATCAADAAVTPGIFAAAYNYFLVEADKSEGVHNTALTVQLLQSGWLAITGNEYCADHPAGTCTKR